MAPPIPRTRQAVTVRRRSPGDVLIGLLAIAALLALTIGVPFALVRFVGVPIPHSLPTLSVLTHQLDIFAILKVLSVIVWLAWLQLVWCVIAEVRAAVRNSGMPARVPLAGGTQALVHRLVTAALLLFTAAAVLSPAFAHHGPAAAPHPSSVTAGPSLGSAAQAGPGEACQSQEIGQPAVTRTPQAEKIYVVKPPVGRYHESLWEIAQKYLGDGRRYRDIFELNKDRVQPDGSRLTIASLIRPGWILQMPGDAHGPGIEVVAERAAGTTPAPQPTASPGQGGQRGAGGLVAPGLHATARAEAPGRGPSAARASAGATGTPANGTSATGTPANGTSATGTPANGTSATGTSANGARATGPSAAGSSGTAAGRNGSGPGTATLSPQDHVFNYPDELAAAALLAAGLLAALGRRRREQLWQRAFGRRVVLPEGEPAEAEAALRIGAQEPAARLLDSGLRYLSHTLALAGRTPPTVFAAHLSSENLDLWVAPADMSAPSPWTAVGDGQVWRLPFSAVQRVDGEEASGALAPFPGLVSIGTDATGRVLVDLEAAHGLISVTGPPDTVLAALSAMAMELATNRWSDRMHITLVGFGADLTLLAPDRVTSVRTLDEALPAMEARAQEVAEAMASSGIGSVLTGRSLGINPEAWAPHYLIMATPPTPEEQDRLLALAQVRHAAAAGYVVAGDIPGAAWTWEISEDGRLRAGLLGFDVAAQVLPPRQHQAVVQLFHAAGQTAGVPLPVPPPDAAPSAQLVPGSVMPVEITMLGQLSVLAPGVIEPDRVALVTELVVYLAAHPGGVHPNVLSGAIWPRGATEEIREAALDRAREWLGTDTIGRPHLATDAGGRLRLGSGVRVDWQVFRALAGHAAQAPPDSAEEADYLARALDLVGGQLLDGRPPGRYAWLAVDGLEGEISARVADAAHRLAALRLAAGDPDGAMAAARTGLRLAFNDELLWRDLLRAADATGDEDLVRDIVAEVCARTWLDEVLPRMAPETEALIDEILPTWRSSVA